MSHCKFASKYFTFSFFVDEVETMFDIKCRILFQYLSILSIDEILQIIPKYQTYQESMFLSIHKDQQECQWTKAFKVDGGKYGKKRKRMKNWGKTGGRLRTDRQRDKHETPSRTSRGKLSLNDGHSWFLPNANNVLQVFKVANPNQVLPKLLHVFVKIGSCHSTMVTLGSCLQQCVADLFFADLCDADGFPCVRLHFCGSSRCCWYVEYNAVPQQWANLLLPYSTLRLSMKPMSLSRYCYSSILLPDNDSAR